jgi:glutamate--cysteine ligase
LTHIENKKNLVDYFINGSKEKSSWKIGTEHEKFLFDIKNKNPIPYEGAISITKIFS